jgi:hypothetical protein
MPAETSLYQPVKRYLETLGFTVKGEVCGCDLVAVRGDEPPIVVIGELKLSFSLDLVLQAVDRAAACDEVWLAVGAAGRGRLRARAGQHANAIRPSGGSATAGPEHTKSRVLEGFCRYPSNACHCSAL